MYFTPIVFVGTHMSALDGVEIALGDTEYVHNKLPLKHV